MNLSVILYNEVRTIKSSIKFLNVNVQYKEIIVVDDFSSDNIKIEITIIMIYLKF